MRRPGPAAVAGAIGGLVPDPVEAVGRGISIAASAVRLSTETGRAMGTLSIATSRAALSIGAGAATTATRAAVATPGLAAQTLPVLARRSRRLAQRTVSDLGAGAVALGPRRRRRWSNGRRVHVEFRSLTPDEFATFSATAHLVLEDLEGVEWVEINPFTERVVVSVRDGLVGSARIADEIERIEIDLGLDTRPFGPIADHPTDRDQAGLAAVSLAIDAVALSLSLARRLGRGDYRMATADAAQLVLAVQYLPSVRALLEGRSRRPVVDLSVTALAAGLHAATGRPAGPAIGLLEHGLRLHGADARYEAWAEREPDLYAKPTVDGFVRTPLPPRPPIPDGPLERAERAIPAAALGAAAAALPLGRSRERAAGILATAAPRAVKVGRSVFCNAVIHTLGHRGVIALDAAALELADRVDIALFDADTLIEAPAAVSDIIPCSLDAPEAWRHAEALLDPYAPQIPQRGKGYRLAPVSVDDAVAAAPESTRLRVRRTLGRPGVLGAVLTDESDGDDRVAAIVAIRPHLRPGTPALLDAIRDAGLRLGVITAFESVRDALGADLVLEPSPDPGAVVASIRALQAEGHVVWLTAGAPLEALEAADLALGLPHPLSPVAWSADLLGRELRDAEIVADACGAARHVSRRCARLSVGGSLTGGALAALTTVPGAAGRATAAVEASSLAAAVIAARAAWSIDARERAPAPDPTRWETLDADTVVERVGSSRRGLTADEATQRLIAPPREMPPAIELARDVAAEIWNPLTPVLAAGAALSWMVGSPTDAATVGAVIALDAVTGGAQRFRADRAVRNLAATIPQKVRVRRDGSEIVIATEEVVVGDLLVIGAGERVPADSRLLFTSGLFEVDEASLTGESALVPKDPAPTWAHELGDRTSMLYEDSVVAIGQAEAITVATGAQTEVGRASAIASRSTAHRSGLEERLEGLTRITLPVAGVAGVGVGAIGMLRGRPIRSVLSTAVSLAVAAIPEGLPLLATGAELAAARRLSDRQILVHQPRTIEALGRVDELVLDKTGTLTEGRLRVERIFDGLDELEPSDPAAHTLLGAAALATPGDDAEAGLHPTDAAIRAASIDHGAAVAADVVASLPFDPARGYHAALMATDGEGQIVVKGAPEVVLARCRWSDPASRTRYEEAVEAMAGRGLRILALGRRARSDGAADDLSDDDISDLEPLGLVALGDTIRPTAAAAVARCRAAGVRLRMVTGDHPATAAHIARTIGLLEAGPDRVLTGPEIDDLDDEVLATAIADVDVVARATPTHKVRIVAALQQAEATVAMVGDGANDTASIRTADVGIALGADATRAARSNADLLVLDDGLDSIVDAIAEGRAMWSSVQDGVGILLGHNVGEIAFTTIGSVFDGTPPLSARQILLVNLLTDVIPTMAVVLRPSTPAHLDRLLADGPRRDFDDFLVRDVIERAVVTAAGASLGWGTARLTGTPARARTVGLVSLVATQLGQTLLIGGNNRTTWLATAATAAIMMGTVQTPGVSQLFGCRPLGPLGWATALGAATTANAGHLAAGRLGDLVAR